MDEETLKNVIEALLFAADEPLTTRRLAAILKDVDGHEVRRIVTALADDYKAANRGVQIEEIAGGFRLLSNLDYAAYVEQLHKTERRVRLSQAALETLAIVAYKQPIHRADI